MHIELPDSSKIRLIFPAGTENTLPGVFVLYEKDIICCFVPPILLPFESSRVAFKRPSGYVIRLPSTVLRRVLSLFLRKKKIDMMRLSGYIGSKLDMFHEQLPLPVPCYDLVPVTELTLGPTYVDTSGTPGSLDLTGGEYKT